MNTKIEYKKGILLIKIYGILIGSKIEEFENRIIPIILSLKANKVMINLSCIDLIDKKGIDAIIKISNVVNRFDGKLVLYELNDYMKTNLSTSNVYDYCFKSRNERTGMEVFKI